MGSVGNKEFTKEQLENRNVGLVEVVGILEKCDIPYRIASGTLLGFYRDNAFIPWDNDVDLSFNVDDIYSRTEELLQIFTNQGFEIRNVKMDLKCYSLVINKYGSRYELSGFHEKGKYMVQLPKWNVGWKYPKDLFNEVGVIKFNGKEYTTFKNIENFLLLQYGDWNKEKRSRYLTYKVRVNYFNPFIRVFLKIQQFLKFLKSF
jgi:phosphorylcholine metabolism protein LicD